MKTKVFFGKFLSAYLWGNILAMMLVVVLLCLGVKYGLNVYTHHGENIPVPDLKNMSYVKAKALIESNGLRVVVNDSGYNKMMPAGTVLAQSPDKGSRVKQGHTVYLTINSLTSPMFAIPDLADNSSIREAEVKLKAIGFRLLEPQYVTGEKDWVYGILCNGKHVFRGDMVSIETPLKLVVGSGMYEDEDVDIDYSEPDPYTDEPETDEFEEVTAPPAEIAGLGE